MWGVVGDNNICVLSSLLFMRMIRSCHLAALCRAPENQLKQNDINGDRLHYHAIHVRRFAYIHPSVPSGQV